MHSMSTATSSSCFTCYLCSRDNEGIIFFGDVPKECEGNIEHHAPYYDTFTKGLAFSERAR